MFQTQLPNYQIMSPQFNSLRIQTESFQMLSQLTESKALKTDNFITNTAISTHNEIPERTNRTEHWSKVYGERLILDKYTINLKKTLIMTKIQNSVRSQMIEWMIEVFSKISTEFREATFFRAVFLMDFYIKQSKIVLKDKDIHLIGITCMFIASKYEDVHPISLHQFYTEVGFEQIPKLDILNKEFVILSTIGYQISFRTTLDILDFYTFKLFSGQTSESITLVIQLSRNFAILCLSEVGFNDFDVKEVALACLLNASLFLINFSVSFQLNSNKMFEPDEFVFITEIIKSFMQKLISENEFDGDLFQKVSQIRYFLKKFKKENPGFVELSKFANFEPKLMFN